MPYTPLDPDQTVAQLQQIRDGYLNDLANDVIGTTATGGTPFGTQPDYSLDGQSVSRDAWRAALMKRCDEINELIQKYQPFEMHSVGW